MTFKKLITRSAFVLSYMFSISLIGQGEANIWYMGQEIGLDFSTDPPTLIDGLSSIARRNCETSISLGEYDWFICLLFTKCCPWRQLLIWLE